MNPYSTYTLLMGIEEKIKPSAFLTGRYTPTNAAKDIFKTKNVLVEYKDGTMKIAPLVAPRKGGKAIHRGGSRLEQFEPANIAPKRVLTLDDLEERNFGEALYSDLSPESRALALALDDAAELNDMITRRIEAMVAEMMINNSCVMAYKDDLGNVIEEKEVIYYDGDSNPAIYTPQTKWNQSGAKIKKDIGAMVKCLTQDGKPATDALISPDLVDIFQNNEEIYKLLDNRRYELGKVESKPLNESGSAYLVATICIDGRWVNIISYDEMYENDNGIMTPYLPQGTVIVTAPNAGKVAYGAVTQMEKDEQFHTYAGMRVPKVSADINNNVREFTLTSKPLPMPIRKNPWISAKVI